MTCIKCGTSTEGVELSAGSTSAVCPRCHEAAVAAAKLPRSPRTPKAAPDDKR